NDEPPARLQTIPEECLPVERIVWTVDESRSQRCNRNPAARVKLEQETLALRFLRAVRVGDTSRHERRILVVLAARRIDSDARHEHVTLEIAALSGGDGRGADLLCRRSTLPIVHIVKNNIEAAA